MSVPIDHPATAELSSLRRRFHRVRSFSDRITDLLTIEDCVVQSMPDVSPTRWHLGHTTWFFETFVLKQHPGYRVFDEPFDYLFNSYYNAVGPQFPRPQRGLITRPGLERVRQYRAYVDEQMDDWFESTELSPQQAHVIRVGINHEQQHQELILTDIKHVLSCNPMLPEYDSAPFADGEEVADSRWIECHGGIHQVGYADGDFAYDNESPGHEVLLSDFAIADRLVTCDEYLQFIDSGGYQNPAHWLSLGWATAQQQNWTAPLYWLNRDGEWFQFTLSGLQPLRPDWPVCHLSYFEADAFARWSGKRLPTEFEWEVAARTAAPGAGWFVDQLCDEHLAIHPTGSARADLGLSRLFGNVWQWTSSSYAPYPGYRPPDGALGEYNGKFMCNQYVLRGGSVATSSDHIRASYRNFFPPEARWQFSGLRLAR